MLEEITIPFTYLFMKIKRNIKLIEINNAT